MFWNKDKKETRAIKVAKGENEHNNDNDRFVTQYHSYCRTVALAHESDPRPIYWEIFCQPNSTDKWQLRQVMMRINDDSNFDDEIDYKTLKTDLDFQNAIHKLSQFERATEELNRYHVGETAEELGIKHFIIVTEQEELLFDKKGYPHKVFTGHVPQTDGHFRPKDVQRAVKNHETTKDLEKISQERKDAATTFFSRIFNTVVKKTSPFEAILDSLDNIKTLDIFHDLLKQTCSETQKITNTRDYTKFNKVSWYLIDGSVTIRKLSFEQYVTQEWNEKNNFEVKEMPCYFNVLNTFGKMHQLISDLANENPLKEPMRNTAFLTEATHNIVYAQNLFQKSINSAYLTENASDDIRALQECAEEILKTKLNINSQEDIQDMKQLIIQGDDLSSPKAIKDYLEKYTAWRSTLINTKSSNVEYSLLNVPKFPTIKQ